MLCFRDLWSEAGGNGALWTPVWEQARSYAGRAVCGFHPAMGPSGGGSIQAARTGQPGQRAAGCLRLRRKTLFWLVRKHMSVPAAWISSVHVNVKVIRSDCGLVELWTSGTTLLLLLAWNKTLQRLLIGDLNERGFQHLFALETCITQQRNK